MTLRLAVVNMDRLSFAALVVLAEHARHAVGWECHPRAMRLELQELADALDADLARRRAAFRGRVVQRWPG